MYKSETEAQRNLLGTQVYIWGVIKEIPPTFVVFEFVKPEFVVSLKFVKFTTCVKLTFTFDSLYDNINFNHV